MTPLRRVVLAALAATALVASETATVTLKNGATIQAPILRHDQRGVVLDLGAQVLGLTTNEIAAIDLVAAAAADPAGVASGDLFTTGRLPVRPVADLVDRFGDAVVLVSTPRGLGSGFFISADGHLLTNYHVVEGETAVTVTVYVREDGDYRKRELEQVRILALQPLRDLALLQVDQDELGEHRPPHVVLASADDAVTTGSAVFAIGNPLGLERTVTQGIVSSTLRTIGHLRFLQTDASINPGNSGGPLFNQRGEVVGVVCAGATFFDGLAFGIPVGDVLDFLEHRAAWLYDDAQPQNGITYHPPPGATPRPNSESEHP